MANPIEQHPLKPFLPINARVLMLGSFPPKRNRWSMEFFYPNWINDMWRIVGYLFFGNKHHFEIKGEKRFDKERIVNFCASKGIALFDAATAVRRLKDNASDKFLEVATPTDIQALLKALPACQAIVVTGEKAAEIVAAQFGCSIPSVGSFTSLRAGARTLQFWRMPSSSRAYPLTLEKKAEFYRKVYTAVGIF
ncbi:MAG: uracil-DNA glycosylase family protein [Alistipes sp.]|nr:uracil-DNA glycosylase family protein [Alistipes sp.]